MQFLKYNCLLLLVLFSCFGTAHAWGQRNGWKAAHNMKRKIEIGQTYRHYKGNLYQVLSIARSSDNPDEQYVIYRALYKDEKFGENAVWMREYHEFMEVIEHEGHRVARFEMM